MLFIGAYHGNSRRIRFNLFGLIFSLLLSSCAVGPNYTKPAFPLPKQYNSKSHTPTAKTPHARFGNQQQLDTEHELIAQWWTLFHSKALNDLVKESFLHNPTIDVAKTNLQAALENVYTQRGAFYPFAGLSFIPSKQQTASILTSVLASNRYNYSLYTGQIFVSYVPDIFGGTRRQYESLVAQAESQHFQLEAAYITLATNVVNAAIQEAALREQISVTQQMIEEQSQLVSIAEHQLKLGDAAFSDLMTQETQLAAFKASLPPLEKQLAIQRDLINALTGRFPDDKTTPIFHFSAFTLPETLPLSLPSTLMEHRPDIRASEAQMKAANALIGVAIANRLPNLTIGFSNAGTASTSLGSLFQEDTNFWSLAGILTHPLFDAGTLKHKQAYAKAMYQQSAAQYKLTVINAFQNMSDVLNAIRIDALALQSANTTARLALKHLDMARHEFAHGSINTASVLLSKQAFQQAKLNLIQAQTNRLTDTVALFQALGGGWWNKPSCSPSSVGKHEKNRA